ncbi:MAG: hypothetical protein MZV64_48660 [Ignavibacteriales bacterium]|nr:hypothetical protein [Ignavibacteriales bacterium]
MPCLRPARQSAVQTSRTAHSVMGTMRSRLLGHGDELARRHEFAAALPAHQRFGAARSCRRAR